MPCTDCPLEAGDAVQTRTLWLLLLITLVVLRGGISLWQDAATESPRQPG